MLVCSLCQEDGPLNPNIGRRRHVGKGRRYSRDTRLRESGHHPLNRRRRGGHARQWRSRYCRQPGRAGRRTALRPGLLHLDPLLGQRGPVNLVGRHGLEEGRLLGPRPARLAPAPYPRLEPFSSDRVGPSVVPDEEKRSVDLANCFSRLEGLDPAEDSSLLTAWR